MIPVRETATRDVAQGEGHQHHPDLAGPHVKPAAEILGQEPHPHDFQDHHREASKEDQQKRNKFLFYQV